MRGRGEYKGAVPDLSQVVRVRTLPQENNDYTPSGAEEFDMKEFQENRYDYKLIASAYSCKDRRGKMDQEAPGEPNSFVYLNKDNELVTVFAINRYQKQGRFKKDKLIKQDAYELYRGKSIAESSRAASSAIDNLPQGERLNTYSFHLGDDIEGPTLNPHNMAKRIQKEKKKREDIKELGLEMN